MTATDPRMTADPVAAARRAVEAAEPEFGRYFLIHFLGLSIAYADDEQSCTVALPFAPHLCNAAGVVHGGVLSTVLDISMGHACHRFLSAGTTIDMEMHFHRAVRTDAVCTGRSCTAAGASFTWSRGCTTTADASPPRPPVRGSDTTPRNNHQHHHSTRRTCMRLKSTARH